MPFAFSRRWQRATCVSPTPTAASAADQVLSLSWLRVLHSLTHPAPYSLTHTSDTTRTALLDEFLIQVDSIGQDHVPKDALILVVAMVMGLDGYVFPKGEVRGGVLGVDLLHDPLEHVVTHQGSSTALRVSEGTV